MTALLPPPPPPPPTSPDPSHQLPTTRFLPCSRSKPPPPLGLVPTPQIRQFPQTVAGHQSAPPSQLHRHVNQSPLDKAVRSAIFKIHPPPPHHSTARAGMASTLIFAAQGSILSNTTIMQLAVLRENGTEPFQKAQGFCPPTLRGESCTFSSFQSHFFWSSRVWLFWLCGSL